MGKLDRHVRTIEAAAAIGSHDFHFDSSTARNILAVLQVPRNSIQNLYSAIACSGAGEIQRPYKGYGSGCLSYLFKHV